LYNQINSAFEPDHSANSAQMSASFSQIISLLNCSAKSTSYLKILLPNEFLCITLVDLTLTFMVETKYGQKWTRKMAKNGQKPNDPSKPTWYVISKNGLTFVPRPKMAEMALGHLWPLLAIFGPIWPSCEAAMGPYDYRTHTNITEKFPRHFSRQKKTLMNTHLGSKPNLGKNGPEKWPKHGQTWPKMATYQKTESPIQ
jgi:hypothetical protein